MHHPRIRLARRTDGQALLGLIDALADFERLNRPTPAARQRLLQDAFGRRKRFTVYLAFVGRLAVGYAIVFETYSSFLALPTLFLEDIFILPGHRRSGIGGKLFRHCVKEARARGCGRMEWIVLDWNHGAQRFYNELGAQKMKEWQLFRLTL